MNHSKVRMLTMTLTIIVILSVLSLIPVSYASTPSVNIYCEVEKKRS